MFVAIALVVGLLVGCAVGFFLGADGAYHAGHAAAVDGQREGWTMERKHDGVGLMLVEFRRWMMAPGRIAVAVWTLVLLVCAAFVYGMVLISV